MRTEFNDISVLNNADQFNVDCAVIEQIKTNKSNGYFRYHLVVVKDSRVEMNMDCDRFIQAKFRFWKEYTLNDQGRETDSTWNTFVELSPDWLSRNPSVDRELYKTRQGWWNSRGNKT
ncbi:MAG: hypothetical protein GY940_08520, partial [bacterium]|nr:hypothetical protein [bacterium]